MTTMNAVLIVEHEKHIAEGLRYNLEAEGFAVDVAVDAESAEDLLLKKHKPYDVVVLDVMLPGKNGFALASTLRKAEHFVPILMLTARGEAQDVLRGFEAGADDYLPKPFELAVLIARLNALLRRREWLKSSSVIATRQEPVAAAVLRDAKVIEFDGKTIDFDALELRSGNHTVRLTVMEADLLRYLIKHDGRIVSRRSILEDVWGLREDTDTRAIDNFIVRLRKYIEDEPSKPKHLVTVRGVGYKFISKAGAKKN